VVHEVVRCGIPSARGCRMARVIECACVCMCSTGKWSGRGRAPCPWQQRDNKRLICDPCSWVVPCGVTPSKTRKPLRDLGADSRCWQSPNIRWGAFLKSKNQRTRKAMAAAHLDASSGVSETSCAARQRLPGSTRRNAKRRPENCAASKRNSSDQRRRISGCVTGSRGLACRSGRPASECVRETLTTRSGSCITRDLCSHGISWACFEGEHKEIELVVNGR
jgi:hypothetical protein